MHESKPALIAEWQRGVEQAVHDVFDLYYPPLVRLAVLSGLTQEEAQDCAQEVFLRAFERRRQLRNPATFVSWFHRIAVRHIQDMLKARRRVNLIPLEDASEFGEDWERSPLPQPDELAIATEMRVQLWQRVQALPVHYRVPLILRYYGDFSYREIADVLGKREGAIRVMLHRALHTLRLLSAETHPQEQPPRLVDPEYTNTIQHI